MRALFILLTFAFINQAGACEFVPDTPLKKSFEDSTLIFRGKTEKVVKSESAPTTEPGVITSFKISKVWKGADLKSVDVLSFQAEGLCGREFEQSKEYIVFAREVDGKYYLTDRRGSRSKISSDAKEELKFLEKKRAK